MIRAILFRMLLLALPFILYEAYLILMRLQAREPISKRKPWTLLFTIGLSLAIMSFILEGLLGGETTKGVYIAPHVVDGKVVPGRVEP